MKNKREPKIEYFINHEKRVIVAAICDCDYDFVRSVIHKFNFAFGSGIAFSLQRGKYLLPKKIIARAKCHPDDEFDVGLGMTLAHDRVMEKYTVAFNKRLVNFQSALEEITCASTDLFKDEVYL